MKRIGNLWPLICALENMEKAASDALSGKRLTSKERRFAENRASMLDQLEASLLNETYRFGSYHSFVVHEPKERRIDPRGLPLFHHPQRCDTRPPGAR